jgi:hypothetical protein
VFHFSITPNRANAACMMKNKQAQFLARFFSGRGTKDPLGLNIMYTLEIGEEGRFEVNRV